MVGLKKGRYVARLAQSDADIRAAQALRHLAFHGTVGLDADEYDVICNHILVEERKSGELVCCFRMLPLSAGNEISRSYSAQFYELSALEEFEGSMVESPGQRFGKTPGTTGHLAAAGQLQGVGGVEDH